MKKRRKTASLRLPADDPAKMPQRAWEDIEAVIKIIDEFAPPLRERLPEAAITPLKLWRIGLRVGPNAKRSLH